MIKFLNFCCEIAALPKKFRVAVAKVFIVMLGGAFFLAALGSIPEASQFNGFWMVEAATWIIYFSTLGSMCRKIYVKWHAGEFHIDERGRF